MNVFELVGKLTLDGADKVNQQLSGLEKNVQKVQKGMRVAGAAFTAVGVAGLALVQSTKKINAQLGVTALNLGITVKEMRSLTLATTNVTFPIEEVTKTFDLLARAGVEDQQVLQDTATAFDTLGDAIGVPASLVTEKLIPTMKTFNLTAEEVAGKTDAMTYLFRNTTVSLDDFNRMVGYVTPDLVKMGLTTEDMIAILADLEDQGYSGEVMTREFRKAVTLATKEQIPLNEALGISTETIESYKGELEGATGITQEYADVANEQYTIMDKIKQKFSEITLGMSGFLEPLEPVLAGMTALGPVMLIVATNTKIATLATRLFGAAWKMALGPIGWAIAGVGLLVTAGIALHKNWDKVQLFFKKLWANMEIVFGEAIKFIVGTVLQPFLLYVEYWIGNLFRGLGKVVSFFNKEWGAAIEKVADGIQNLEETMTDWADKLIKSGETSKKALTKVGEAFEDIIPFLEDVARASELTTDDMLRDIQVLTREAGDSAKERTRAEISAIDDQMDAHRDAHRERMDALQDEYNATIKTIDAELAYALRGYQSQIEAIDRQIEDIEDAEKGRRDAERKGELEASIAEEGDADKRLDLERRLDEFLIESDNELWRKERELAYETRIAEEKDADERRGLEQRLADFLLEVQAKRTRQQLETDRDTLRQEMDMAREEASNAKDRAQEAYEYRSTLQEQEHNDLISHLEREREVLDAALEAKLKQYDDDEKAFKAMLGVETKGMEDFIAAYNALIGQMQDKTITLTTIHKTIILPPEEPPPIVEPPKVPKVPDWTWYDFPEAWTDIPTAPAPGELWEKGAGWQKGVIAMREMVGRIGEQAPRIPEAVLPLTKETFERLGLIGGGLTIDIHDNEFNVREDEDIDRIGEALVDKIYQRTGVHLR